MKANKPKTKQIEIESKTERIQNGNDAKTNPIEPQTKRTERNENEIDSNGDQTKRKQKRHESDAITNQLGIEKRYEYDGFLNRCKREKKAEDFIRRPTQRNKKTTLLGFSAGIIFL